MNNISNNSVSNRGVAPTDQTTNTASTNSRSRGALSSAGALLSSALHGQIVRRSPADARTLNQAPRNEPANSLLITNRQLLLKPIKDVATAFQQTIRKSELMNVMSKYRKFHAAVEKGEIEVVKRLLKDKQIDTSSIGYSAIPCAIKNGQSAVVNLLLNDKRVGPTIDHNEIINWLQDNVDKASYSEIAHNHALPQFTAIVQALSSSSASSFPNELITHQLINFHPALVDMLFLSTKPEEKQVAVAELVQQTILTPQQFKS